MISFPVVLYHSLVKFNGDTAGRYTGHHIGEVLPVFRYKIENQVILSRTHLCQQTNFTAINTLITKHNYERNEYFINYLQNIVIVCNDKKNL